MRVQTMRGRRCGGRWILGAVVLLTGAAASPALAQERSLAPTPKRADTSPPVIWNYFVLIVVAGAVFGANLIPSKRGHQD